MWDLPGPGIEPVSPALAGGFFTTEPPGKPPGLFWNSCGLRLFLSTKEASHRGRGTPMGCCMAVAGGGPRGLTVQAALHPPPYAQSWVCSPEVRTEEGLGWVRNELGFSARNVDCALSMPGLHFSLSGLTFGCCEAGEIQEAGAGWGCCGGPQQGEEVEGQAAWERRGSPV